MPAVNSGKILVTGANGYVATWAVNTLLEQGFSVRGTVRSAGKAAALQEQFKKYGDKLEIIVIEEISEDGAFDEAVQGIDAIAHIASPCHLNGDDPQEYIRPAVSGTVGLLQSALTHGPAVQRIAIASSCATMLDESATQPRFYTADDWATAPVREVEEKGRGASALAKYCASKILAERAVWKFVEAHRGRCHFDVVTLCAPHVFGPPFKVPADKSGLTASMNLWLAKVLAADDTTEGHEWIDVRDFALAHVLAIQRDAAGDSRIIVAAGEWKWQDWVNAAHAVDKRLPQGDTSYDHATATHYARYDHSKAERLLGLKCRSIEETTKDVIGIFQIKGWVP